MPFLVGLGAFARSVQGIAIIALLAALLVQTVRIEGFKFWPLSIDGLKAELADAKDARAKDRTNYEQAQRAAADKNKAEVARITAAQDKVTNDVQADLTARLERLRRELRQVPPATGGAPGSPKAGPDGKSGGGTPQAAGVCLAAPELLRAAENEERHDQLITWVEKQLGIVR